MYLSNYDDPRFTKAEIADWLTCAWHLNPQPGPGGAGMTDPARSLAVFEPRLKHYFPGTWHACTVCGLWPSQQIPLHADALIRGVRYHIPLQTNAQCWTLHGTVWQQLAVGRMYEMDPTQPHGAVNWGSEIRLHLMIDVDQEPGYGHGV